MLDDLRRFSTDAYPADLRSEAWDEVLARAGLRQEAPAPHHPPLAGYVFSRQSGRGGTFIQVASSPQCWGPRPGVEARAGHALLAVLLTEGSALATDGQASVALKAGEAVVLDPVRPWQLSLITPFRALVVSLASASFALRLLRAGTQELPRISRDTATGSVCVSVMRGVADELERLDADELAPLEATLSDLLVACLSHREERDDPAQATSVQLGHLRRVCRTIESRLTDSELDLEEIARLEGLSTRYVQKLFKAGGTSFGDHLRERRLERCRADLGNPSLAHVTISELCFRWGFGDAANFSRAFTARYGQSPKAFRAMPSPQLVAVRLPTHRGRPLPGGGPAAPAHGEGEPTSDPALRHSFQQVLRDHADYVQALALAPKRAAPLAASGMMAGQSRPPHHHYVPVSDKTVHWGYFSRSLKPVITVASGDVVTLETLTQHASDDRERMIEGDLGAESVFHWTADRKAVDRRGAGPMDASVYGRGAGEGFGVHICTGPVYVQDAEPGDVLEVRILDIRHRPSASPRHRGRIFGSNAAAWWGFHHDDLITEPKKREVVTLYEIHPEAEPPHAKAVYNFRWTPQTDPFGVVHETIDYPGVPVDEHSVYKRYGVLADACVPVRPHFGVLAVAPRESELVDSIPPGYFGGNLDNWRAGKGASLFLPVAVPGALFSAGDPHASQGDAEVCGTAIECSLTGVFQLVLHKRRDCAGSFLADLDYPFLETDDAWLVQGFSFANHLAELGPKAQAEVYTKSSLEGAMRDAFRKARRYLMQAHGLDEDEAVSLISVGVDFGVTQVVDGNWGVHAVIRKSLFPGRTTQGSPVGRLR